MNIRLVSVALAVGLSVFPAAAQSPQPADSRATHAMTLSESLSFKLIRQTVLSDDGHWLAYHVASENGDGEVVVRALQGDKEQSFSVSKGSASSLVFSDDSRWLAFSVRPARKQGDALKQQMPVHSGLELVNLVSGVAMKFDDVNDFAFSGKDVRWLAMHKPQVDAVAKDPSKDKPTGSDLVLRELATGAELNVGNISNFAFDKSGKWLAMTVDAQDRSGNGLDLRNMATGATTAIDNGSAVYERFSWTESGDGLVVLKGWRKKDIENKLYAVVGVSGISSGSPQKVVYDPTKDESFPANMAISGNRNPKWTDSMDALLFGICDNEKKLVPDAGASNQEKPNLMIWNWQDTRLQSEQQAEQNSDRQFSYLALYRPRDNRFIRLSDEALRDVREPKTGHWAIGIDKRAYAFTANIEALRGSFQDIYSVDLGTGSRRLLASKIGGWNIDPSPDDSRILYYNNGDYYVCVLDSGDCRNITAHAPTSFVDLNDDHNIEKMPIPPQGWTNDSKAVLLWDSYDLWRVPVDGAAPSNLTVDGRKEGITYHRYGGVMPLSLDDRARENGYDLSQPLYLGIQDERTKKNGIARINPGQPGAQRLFLDDADFGPLPLKAKNAPVFVYGRQTHQTPAELYVTGPDFAGGKKLTDLSAQLRDIAWSSGAVLVNFTSAKGDKLQAALYLPANYEKGRVYPTIVHVYEHFTTGINLFKISVNDPFNRALYTSHGYAVLEPDIKYRVNDPGMSVVWCVVPAVKAAISAGIVDAKHVGLVGHSWGGYETAFLVTQTNIFAAAAPLSSLTDMVSMWGILYDRGHSNGPGFEGGGQARFAGPPLDNMEAYVRNSPVFQAKNMNTPLLMLSDDSDALVNFTQGMEYYNTLRRMGKPVVLLDYLGEGHFVVKPPNKLDFEVRLHAFFDHFLKDAPAPDWWSKGVSLTRLQAEIKEGTVEKTAEGADSDSVLSVQPRSH